MKWTLKTWKANSSPEQACVPTPSRIKAIILCNPQNPVGRLWNREELTRLGEIVIASWGDRYFR